VRSNGEIDLPAKRFFEMLNAQEPSRTRYALDLVFEMRLVTRKLAQWLHDAGVPILLDEPPDLIALVLLLLLNPEDLDWAHPEKLAEGLTRIPDFGFDIDGRGIHFSDRLNARQRRDADLVRQHYRERQPGFGGEAVRNRGGRPQGSRGRESIAETLAGVLPQVLERFPNATASQLQREWTGPGKRLRGLMGDRWPPSETTLRRALGKISTNKRSPQV
jgi:hypothetical protein